MAAKEITKQTPLLGVNEGEKIEVEITYPGVDSSPAKLISSWSVFGLKQAACNK